MKWNVKRRGRILIPAVLFCLLAAGCGTVEEPPEEHSPNGPWAGGTHPYNDLSELSYIGYPLAEAPLKDGVIRYQEITEEDMEQYEPYVTWDNGYDVDGGAYRRIFQQGGEDRPLPPAAGEADGAYFSFWRGYGGQCALEADGGFAWVISLNAKRGEVVSLVGGDLDLLGEPCRPFLALLRQRAADSSACSEVSGLSPLVLYFYHQREKEGGEDRQERFLYYVYWRGEEERLLQWTTPWTDIDGPADKLGQSWMRSCFQADLPKICGEAASQTE